MPRRLVMLVVAAAIGGCSSPEATRVRAGGPGADVGNHGPIDLHEGAKPYYRTPTTGATLVPRPRTAALAATSGK